jgi:hypothetical protein
MEPLTVPRRKKSLYFATWLVALALTGRLSPLTVLFLPLFPVGLGFALFGHSDDFFQVSALVVGWLFYLLHGVALLTSKSGSVYWVLYGILIVALLLNMQGCQHDLANVAHIH